MREQEIEAYFIKIAKQTDNWQRKFISPNANGVPDRVACINGTTLFIEFKSAIGRLSPMQEREIRKMENAGCRVLVIDSVQGVDKLFETYGTTK